MRPNRFDPRRGFSSNTPVPGLILPLLAAFYDVERLSTLADGALVNFWPDTTGRASLVPNLAAPTYRLNAGRPSVRFDGATNRLVTSAGVTVAQPFSLLCILRITTLAASVLCEGAGAKVTIALDGSLALDCGTSLTLPGAITVSTWTALSCVANGSSSLLRVGTANQTIAQTVGDTGSGSLPATLNIGGDAAGALLFPGDLAQLTICSTALSLNDITGFEQYARNWIG